MSKLSVCLVVYNEEKLIRRCLESIVSIADEIIVVLDGKPRDKTWEICKKYTDKIFLKEHIGFSDPHFPFAFEKTTGDWIMCIDADEFLLPEAAEQVRQLIQEKDIDGFLFLWRIWDGKRYRTKKEPHKPVLFRKSKMFYIGVPHGIMQSYGKTKKIDVPLEHQPLYNNWSLSMFRTKQIPRTKLHAKFISQNFEDISKFNSSINRYSRSILIRKKLCFLFIFLAILRFATDIIKGEKNSIIIKTSFLRGSYEFFLDYYLLVEKVKK